MFEQEWDLPFVEVDAETFENDLKGIDVLAIPDGYANYGLQSLGAKGKKALPGERRRSRRRLAGRRRPRHPLGVSTAREGSPNTNAPGTLVRVTLDGASPLANGIGTRAWVMFQDDDMLHPGPGGISAATYPAASDAAYATSGLALGVPALAGTSAVVDEAVGLGRAVLFAIDPNFRAWTQGTQRILLNALIGPDPVGFGAGGRLEGARRGGEGGPDRGRRPARPWSGDPHPGRDGRHDRRGEGPRTARRRGRPGRPRQRDAAPRRQPQGAVGRGAPDVGPMLDDLAKAGIDVRAASIP